MEQYGFIDAHDPRYIATVERSYRELVRDGLMYRYRTEDDFGLPKSSFTVCTFWMIRSLHVIGREEDARAMFERVLGYANHLGLFSEDIDFETKELLGNFPQGYSHLALIDTAMTISGNEMTAEQKMLSLLGYPFR
jgi:GH15 family glucan-1,4-alpha-glucosidase